jgi:hypothetical protein
MNSSSSPAIHLPLRHDRRAPTWDKQASTLHHFLRDFADLCTEFEIPSDQFPRHVTRYLPPSEIDLWNAVYANLSPSTRTWGKFLEEIYDLYPGSDAKQRSSLSNLDRLIAALTSANSSFYRNPFFREAL